MTYDLNSLIIPGRGTVLFGPVDEKPVNIASFSFDDPSTYSGWEAHYTSEEDLPEFKTDGGDSESKGVWERGNVRVVNEPTTLALTTNIVQLDKDAFFLGVGKSGNTVNADGSIDVHEFGATIGSVQVIMVDPATNYRSGFYMPNTSTKFEELPKLDREEFAALAVASQVLASPKTGTLVTFFPATKFSKDGAKSDQPNVNLKEV